MPTNQSYNSLLTDVPSYAENTAVTSRIGTFIMLAENRIATEYKGLGFQEVVQAAFQNGLAVYPKPEGWKSPISFNYTNAAGDRKPIYLRTYEYCRNFWPTVASTGVPRFYSDYNYDNLLVVPTPNAALNFELLYYCKLIPLDADHQTNWLTRRAPQLLFAAVMLEAQLYLKNWDKVQYWQEQFDRAMAALNGEDQSRKTERSLNTTGKP